MAGMPPRPPPPPGGVGLRVQEHQPKGLVTVRSQAVRCWCLRLKRRSVQDRVLESIGCPRFLIIIWQIFEEIRWVLNRVLLWRPFACLGPCLENLWEPLFALIVQVRLADIAMLIAFILSQAFYVVDAVDKAKTEVPSGNPDEQFQVFALEIGELAAFNFGVAWIFGTRNTAWNLFAGIPFERGIKYHRWMGRWAILTALIHTIGYWNLWIKTNTMDVQSKAPKIVAGYIAMSAAGALFFTSLDWVRRNAFEVFLKAHWFLFVLIFWYSDKHAADFFSTGNAPFYAIIFWAFDIVWRAILAFAPFKKVQVMDVKLLPGNVIRIEFEKGTFEYESGQYIFVCIPALDFTQWHPFSISTCPQDPTVMLHIRVLGGWTRKLRQLAAARDVNWRNLTIYVEGPYGSLSVPLHYYQHVVLVSGGIGITPMQSIFNELVHEIREGRVMKRVHFIWTCRDVSMVKEFADKHWSHLDYGDSELQRMNTTARLPFAFSPDLMFVTPSRRNTSTKEAEIKTHFYLTRVPEGRKNELSQTYPFLFFGRPTVKDVLKEARDAYVDMDHVAIGASLFGVAVLACGPDKMIVDVKKWSAYYGLACHTEVFEF